MAKPRTIWPFDKIKTIDPFTRGGIDDLSTRPPCPDGYHYEKWSPCTQQPNGIWKCGPMRWFCVENGFGIPSGMPIPMPLNPANLHRAETAALAADAVLRHEGRQLGMEIDDEARALILHYLR